MSAAPWAWGPAAEAELRALAPQVLATLVRRHRDFAACEDAVQEALLAAAVQWPRDGHPARPYAWLLTVASRRVVDVVRAESARRARELRDARRTTAGLPVRPAAAGGPADVVGPAEPVEPATGSTGLAPADDTLELLFLCCHPALPAPARMALTLRAVGGLTTAEVARAFLVPEPTMARRIGRAKERLAAERATLGGLTPAARGERLDAVLHVLYLVFNEGYAASSGPALQRRDLAAEAIRLVRQVHRAVPGEPEVAGLLALMLFTDARHAARTAPDGSLVPLAEQDRSRWDRAAIDEATQLLHPALAAGRVGPYQLQAAIAGVHDDAATADATDWVEIVGLYRLLERLAPGPVVTMNRAVAEAEVHGPAVGLALLATIETDPRVAESHRLHAVRAHLLERAGDRAAARAAFEDAARRATSLPERQHLRSRAARLATPP